jgi:hypothetical protein
MESEILEAFEVVSGSRIESRCGARQTVNKHDVSITRKTILLFLESLDPKMTVAELRHRREREVLRRRSLEIVSPRLSGTAARQQR